jgi:hypothetical protein
MVPLNLGLSWWLTLTVGAGGPILGSAISVFCCQVATNALYVRKDLARRRRAAAEEAQGEVPSEPPGTVHTPPRHNRGARNASWTARRAR